MILPLLAGWVALGGVLGVHALATDGEMTVDYIQPSSQSDMLVLTEGREAVICDFSNGSLTAMNRAARTAEEAGASDRFSVPRDGARPMAPRPPHRGGILPPALLSGEGRGRGGARVPVW